MPCATFGPVASQPVRAAAGSSRRAEPSRIDWARHAQVALGPPGPFAQLRLAYRKFLKLEEHRVRLAHPVRLRRLPGGEPAVRTVRLVLRTCSRASWPDGGPVRTPIRTRRSRCWPWGATGRHELNPFSDIDIVFIHPDAPKAAVAPLEEAIIQILVALSELGIELGSQSTFSISQAVETANADMRTKTSFLQSRLLAGMRLLRAVAEGIWLAASADGRGVMWPGAWKIRRSATVGTV